MPAVPVLRRAAQVCSPARARSPWDAADERSSDYESHAFLYKTITSQSQPQPHFQLKRNYVWQFCYCRASFTKTFQMKMGICLQWHLQLWVCIAWTNCCFFFWNKNNISIITVLRILFGILQKQNILKCAVLTFYRWNIPRRQSRNKL